MKITNLKHEYFSPDYVAPSLGLQRAQFRGSRYYYRYDTDGDLYVYPGVTSLLKRVLSTPQELIDWIKRVGEVEANRYFKEREMYGTLLHTLIATFFKNKGFDIDEMSKIVYEYIEEHKLYYLGIDAEGWVHELSKDMIGFAQFVVDKNFDPIGVEVPLYSSMHKCATLVDLWGVMDFNRKRRNVIIDIKSGRGAYSSEAHECQLALCKKMIEQHFPDLEECMLFNYKPKDWRSTPSYTLTNQTGKVPDWFLDNKVKEYYYYEDPMNKSKLVVGGKLKYGETPDAFSYKTLEDYLK